MPIDTHVQGDPGSVRSSAQWLRTLSEAVHQSGTEIRTAGTHAEADWHGPAGAAFLGRMRQAAGQVDELSANFAGAGQAMDAHAADLDTVLSRMDQARGVALAAGLPLTATTICEPGGPPAAPAPLPKGRCPTTAEQQAFNAGTQAVTDFIAQCRAFVECLGIAAGARQIETDSQATLLGVLKDKVTSWMTWADVASGGYAGYLTTSYFRMRQSVDDLGRAADSAAGRAAAVAANPTAPQWFVRSTVLSKLDAGLEAAVAKRSMQQVFGGAMPKDQGPLANGARNTRFSLTMTLGDLAKPSTSWLNNAPKVVKNLPLLGILVTMGTTGYDIAQDPTDPENVVTSLLAGGGSLLAATAVAGLFAPTAPFLLPVAAGALTAFVVDVGIKWATPHVVDFGGEAVDKAGDAAGWVGDKAGGLWKGAKGLLG
jgi:hypothetical protein